MEQLPRIVWDRLRVGAPDQHPDADLLTGFAEHRLTEREREKVVAHLGQCALCRQVLALAAVPPATMSPQAVSRSMGSSWLRWPVLRWGAAAACVIVVGAAVFIGYRPKEQASLTAESRISSDKQALTAEQQRAPAPTAESDQAPASAIRSAPSNQEQATEERYIPHGSTSSVRGKAARKIAQSKPDEKLLDRSMRAKAENSPAYAVLAPAAPTPTRAFENKPADTKVVGGVVGTNAANVVGRADSPRAKDLSIPKESIPKTSADSGTDELERTLPTSGSMVLKQPVTVATAAPPVQSETADLAKTKKRQEDSAAAPAPDGNRGVLDTAASARAGFMPNLKTPKWTLSEDGLPQRSFDSGASWEKIQVDHQAGFRALASNGMEVWVGGRAGLLYHSSDIGLHWVRVIPAAGGKILSADITRIEFSDVQHGTLTTADGQSWATGDGGRNWEKR